MMNERGFCAAVREVRLAEKLTLRQVWKRSGINPAQLSKIEHGDFPTKITTISKLQRGLGLTDDRLLTLLGFKTKKYVHVPIISAHTKNFGRSLANAKTLQVVDGHVPKRCFFVRVEDEMAPLIRKGSLALVNRDFDYQNGKIYAVLLNHDIIVGRVYKSKGHTYSNLVTNERSYFNMDYLGRFTVLGRVIKISDAIV